METDDPTPRWSTQDPAFLRAATELLRAGQYEHLAELLQQVQLAHDRKGDTIPAQVLVLACRICLACSQSQAEAAWHQQACEEATRREDELRRQLTTLLDLAGEGDLSLGSGEWGEIPEAPSALLGPPRPGLPGPEEPLSLWQRFLEVLHLRLGPQPPEEDAQERLPPVAQEPEVPASSPDLPPHDAGPVLPAQPETTKEPSSPSLVVYCLGPFRVYQDDQLITDWPSGKGKAIFKYMLANRDQPIPRDILMDLLWRDADPEAARNNLNVAMYGLRRALRAVRPAFAHVLFQDDHYLLNPAMAVWADFEEFKRRYEAGEGFGRRGKLAEAMREYEIAESLYQGDFLEEDLYEDWPMLRREGLKDSYLVILDRLSRRYLEERRYAACIHLCQRILAKDDCREDAHRRLMRCYSRQGQRNLALRQYLLCAETLARVLDVSPMRETTALYHRVRRGEMI